MRKVLFVLLIACVAFIGCQAKEAEARGGGDPCESFLSGILNECAETHEKTDENYEKYDYGAFLDVLYELNENVDVGVKTTYEHKRNEYTALIGAIIKFGPKEE